MYEFYLSFLEGTYVIHKGFGNTEEKPFDIYVNSNYSNKSGRMRVVKHNISKSSYNSSLWIDNDQTKIYDSIRDMILRNSAKFKKPVVKKFGSVESIPQPSRTSPGKNDEYLKVSERNNRYV